MTIDIRNGFKPLKNNVLVSNLEKGDTITHGGLFVPDDNMSERGIRPRWGRVEMVGPDVDDLRVGQWVLVAHTRWSPPYEFETTNGIIELRQVEYPEGILVVSDEEPRRNIPVNMVR